MNIRVAYGANSKSAKSITRSSVASLPLRAAMSVLSPCELFLLGAPGKAVDAFLSGLPPDMIMRLRVLSSSMFYAIEAYCDRAWNIKTFLGRWFYHVPSFLNVLESSEGIISGTEANQFFDRCRFRGSSLDIYVPWHGVLELGRWLKTRGFSFQSSIQQHILFDAAVIMASGFVGPESAGVPSIFPHKRPSYSTFRFVRPRPQVVYNEVTGISVQLFAVHGNPVEFMLYKFHASTCLISAQTSH